MDGRRILGSHPCFVEVFSVVDVGDERWVQVAVFGRSYALLTLRVPRTAAPSRVLAQIAGWARRTGQTGSAPLGSSDRR